MKVLVKVLVKALEKILVVTPGEISFEGSGEGPDVSLCEGFY